MQGPDRPPAEVTTNGDPGRRGWAETQPDAPPTLGWLGIRGAGARGAGRETARLIPAPAARECEGWPSMLRRPGGRCNLRMRGRGEEEGEESSVKGWVEILGFRGAPTAEATSSGRPFAGGAQVTESPRQPRPLALLENPP